MSVIRLQVHARIKRCDFLAIAVERQCRATVGTEETAFTDAPCGRLTPARMVNLRVHIGVKAIFIGGLLLPRGWRLFFDKADLRDRLDSLEAIFPRHHEPDRCAVR